MSEESRVNSFFLKNTLDPMDLGSFIMARPSDFTLRLSEQSKIGFEIGSSAPIIATNSSFPISGSILKPNEPKSEGLKKVIRKAPAPKAPTLGMGNFQSDSEQCCDVKANDPRKFIAQFLEESSAAAACSRLKKEDFTSLASLITESSQLTTQKTFPCDFCNLTFSAATSKGGHISKVHYNESIKYQQRMYQSKMRRSERQRSNFLKNI